MKLSDFQIVYINLKKRPDRKKYIEKQLDKMGLLDNAVWVEGIDGQSLNKKVQDYWISKFKTMSRIRERILGRIGCYLTHLMVLHAAKMAKVDKLLIIEDDCRFLECIDQEFPDPPKNAELFYLGGLFWTQNKESSALQKKNLKRDWIPIRREHLKLACAMCYGVIGRSKIAQLYDTISQVKPSAIDLLYINYIQKNPDTTYIINPVACIQNGGFTSDVTFHGKIHPTRPFKNSYFYHPKQERLATKLFNL